MERAWLRGVAMSTSDERKEAGNLPDQDEKAESGRSAPIDEDVEGQLNAALPEAADDETAEGSG